MTHITSLHPVSTYANMNHTGFSRDNGHQVQVSNNVLTPKENVFISGEALTQFFGRSVIGESNIKNWKDSGLQIERDTIVFAFEQMNKALAATNGEPGELIFNQHQIVKSKQEVPDWFNKQHTESLNNIQDSIVRERFIAGHLFTVRTNI